MVKNEDAGVCAPNLFKLNRISDFWFRKSSLALVFSPKEVIKLVISDFVCECETLALADNACVKYAWVVVEPVILPHVAPVTFIAWFTHLPLLES